MAVPWEETQTWGCVPHTRIERSIKATQKSAITTGISSRATDLTVQNLARQQGASCFL